MTYITHSVHIARRVEDVFLFITNMENDHHWWYTVNSRNISGGAVGLGTVFTQTDRLGWFAVQHKLEIIDWQPFSKVVFRNESQQTPGTLTYHFALHDSATQFRVEADLVPQGLLRWVMPLMMGVVQRQLETNLNQLKQYVESPAFEALRASPSP